jgi:hypothetical protein
MIPTIVILKNLKKQAMTVVLSLNGKRLMETDGDTSLNWYAV